MSPPLLPAVAVAQLIAYEGIAPVLVARPRSRTLHLHRLDGTGQRDFATTYLASFTDSGRLRKGRRTLCGQRARRWYRTDIDGRPLCRRCSTTALALSPVVDGQRLAQLVPTTDLVRTIVTARTAEDVSAAQLIASTPGAHPMGVKVPGPDGPVLLTRLIGDARTRLEGAAPLTARDHAWAARIRPTPRFPRRVR